MGFWDAAANTYAAWSANESREKAAKKNQEAEAARLRAAQNAPLGTDAIFGTTTTARPGGGYNRAFTPGSSQETASEGNRRRQSEANLLAGTTTAPSQGDVNSALRKRDQSNFKRFSEGLDKLVNKRQQIPGADLQLPGSRFEGATVDAIGRYADANRANTPVEALTLKSHLDREAAALQGQQLANLDDRGIISVPGPGGNMPQAIVQQKLTPTPSDLSGAIPFAAVGGYMADLNAQKAAREEDARYNELYDALRDRQLYNSGSGNMGGYVDPRINNIFPSGSQN